MYAARTILLLVLLVTPWLYGGVHESTQLYVFAAVVGASLCWLVTRRCTDRMPPALFPLLAAVGLGLFQLCALPKPVATLVSPRTVQLRDDLLLDDQPLESNDAVTPASIRYTLSLRPAATRYDLSLLVLAVAGFLLGSLLFCSAPSRLLLCWGAATNGALLALFGLWQRFTWNGRLFWIGPAPSNDNAFSAFVNRNNAGGYLNLCLGAAIVLLLWAANRNEGRLAATTAPSGRRRRAAHGNLSHRLANLDALKVGTATLAALIVGAILCTLSRGAGIAMLGSAIVTALAVIATRKQQMRASGGLIAMLAGAGLVGWVGMRDAMVERFGTLAEREHLLTTGRVPNWRDALRSVADFWPAGSGLGTYRDIYLLYQQRLDATWYYYAENQYVQAIVEAGIPGLALLLLAITAVVAAIWSLLRAATDPLDYALAVGGLFAVVSQIIHSFFDFGLYLPANLLLMAVLCGVVTQRATSLAASKRPPAKFGWLLGGKVQVVLVGSVFVGLILAAREIRTIAATNRVLNEADYSSLPGAATEAKLRAAIDTLQAGLPAATDDAELHYDLAKAWIHLYRVRVFAELRRTSPPSLSIDDLWQQASTAALQRQAHELLRAGKVQELETLRHDPLVSEHLRPARQHLLLARQSCPILSKIHLRLARNCFLAASPACDAIHVQRARRLAPSDPYTFMESGLLDLQAHRIDEACASWRHALALSEGELNDVLSYAIPVLDLDQIVEHVLPANPTLLLRLAKQGLAGIPLTESRPRLARRIELVAEEPGLPEDERHYLLASVYAMRGESTRALPEYEAAVKLRPNELSWRHEFGKLLMQEGRWDEAHEQILWCARRQPESGEFRQLIETIHKSRSSGGRQGLERSDAK